MIGGWGQAASWHWSGRDLGVVWGLCEEAAEGRICAAGGDGGSSAGFHSNTVEAGNHGNSRQRLACNFLFVFCLAWFWYQHNVGLIKIGSIPSSSTFWKSMWQRLFDNWTSCKNLEGRGSFFCPYNWHHDWDTSLAGHCWCRSSCSRKILRPLEWAGKGKNSFLAHSRISSCRVWSCTLPKYLD